MLEINQLGEPTYITGLQLDLFVGVLALFKTDKA
jgi:hypothetical protein